APARGAQLGFPRSPGLSAFRPNDAEPRGAWLPAARGRTVFTTSSDETPRNRSVAREACIASICARVR
ncbi:MAG: hypothetical protein JWM27_3986, partial [Gemmatimonadetes bacterium]|nr:hypothetical protein [Gemmatimonadota bacterium]